VVKYGWTDFMFLQSCAKGIRCTSVVRKEVEEEFDDRGGALDMCEATAIQGHAGYLESSSKNWVLDVTQQSKTFKGALAIRFATKYRYHSGGLVVKSVTELQKPR
jgi:hypothetical protein